MKEGKIQFCQRVFLKHQVFDKPTIILGLLVDFGDGDFILQSGSRDRLVKARAILCVEDTTIPFRKREVVV